MTDIISISHQQKSYAFKSKDEFESTPQKYLEIAQKIISYFAPRYGLDIAKKMLSSEDAISNVATAIMMGDWRWDKDYKNLQKTVRTKRAYRNQCGIWAIKGFVSRETKRRKINILSLNKKVGDSDYEFGDSIPSEANHVADITKNEDSIVLKSKIAKLLDSGVLTANQNKFIKEYYLLDKTLAEIGKENKITREAVRQNVQRGLIKMKELYGDIE